MTTTPERSMPSGLPSQEPAMTESPGMAFPLNGYNGAEVALIHWMLSFIPTERLQVLKRAVSSLGRLRRGNPDHIFVSSSPNAARAPGKFLL
jgi:hypothetical protein